MATPKKYTDEINVALSAISAAAVIIRNTTKDEAIIEAATKIILQSDLAFDRLRMIKNALSNL